MRERREEREEEAYVKAHLFGHAGGRAGAGARAEVDLKSKSGVLEREAGEKGGRGRKRRSIVVSRARGGASCGGQGQRE